MKKKFSILFAVVLLLGFYSCDSGRQGFCYERNADNSIGPKISNVKITFTSEDGSFTKAVITDENAHFKILLPPQRYYVDAIHPEFQSYSSSPEFSVVKKGKIGTLNIFLKKGGKQGHAYERLPDGGIGNKISGVNITFTSKNGIVTQNTTSGNGGEYKLVLDPLKYIVTANHPDFEPFSTEPGFSIVSEGEFTIFNIFLTKK